MGLWCLTPLLCHSGVSVVLVVNNLGGLSCLELGVVAGSAVHCLGECHAKPQAGNTVGWIRELNGQGWARDCWET